jgi:hypothetical protein
MMAGHDRESLPEDSGCTVNRKCFLCCLGGQEQKDRSKRVARVVAIKDRAVE